MTIAVTKPLSTLALAGKFCLIFYAGILGLLIAIISSATLFSRPLPVSNPLTNFRADYHTALNNAILFFEGQRSGKLDPTTMRIKWRNDSGLTDGAEAGIDLVGGYYDAGDNVKFGFPGAYGMTLLAWNIVEYRQELATAGQLNHALDALKWGTDYLLKAHTEPNVYWVEVGEGQSDHQCWERPEDMDTPRTPYQVNASFPGSDVAGEAAAALAASSMVFQSIDTTYSETMLNHSKQLFTFASTYHGRYNDSVPVATPFYGSKAYADELVWAAAWLYRATNDSRYLDYLVENDDYLGGSTYKINQLNWDDKIGGAQILMARVYLTSSFPAGNPATSLTLQAYKQMADSFGCQVLPMSPLLFTTTTPEGLYYVGAVNSQYSTAAAMSMSIYSDYLSAANETLDCGGKVFSTKEIFEFAKWQIDYILGKNVGKTSYMAGYGDLYPEMVHHRGASIISANVNGTKVSCGDGFLNYFNVTTPNPNVHVGAIVGGPNQNDSWVDLRALHDYLEPTIYTNAAAVGVLAKLTSLHPDQILTKRL